MSFPSSAGRLFLAGRLPAAEPLRRSRDCVASHCAARPMARLLPRPIRSSALPPDSAQRASPRRPRRRRAVEDFRYLWGPPRPSRCGSDLAALPPIVPRSRAGQMPNFLSSSAARTCATTSPQAPRGPAGGRAARSGHHGRSARSSRQRQQAWNRDNVHH